MRKCNLTVARLIESPTAANTSGQVSPESTNIQRVAHLYVAQQLFHCTGTPW